MQTAVGSYGKKEEKDKLVVVLGCERDGEGVGLHSSIGISYGSSDVQVEQMSK